jgi:outer membrane protein OmpA-like peptidoglycan-associated protein
MKRAAMSALSAIGLVLMAFGCAQSTPPPKQADSVDMPKAEADGAYHPAAFDQTERYAARMIRLDLDPPFQDCGLSDVVFPYDESHVLPQEVYPLRKLASCLESPPQSQIDLLLVGRTDPRGTDAYNDRLGKARADWVKQRLVAYGVSPSRIRTSSGGEAGTEGDPATRYGYDRRVDVVQLRAWAPR